MKVLFKRKKLPFDNWSIDAHFYVDVNSSRIAFKSANSFCREIFFNRVGENFFHILRYEDLVVWKTAPIHWVRLHSVIITCKSAMETIEVKTT